MHPRDSLDGRVIEVDIRDFINNVLDQQTQQIGGMPWGWQFPPGEEQLGSSSGMFDLRILSNMLLSIFMQQQALIQQERQAQLTQYSTGTRRMMGSLSQK